jgi:hypothetical protein
VGINLLYIVGEQSALSVPFSVLKCSDNNLTYCTLLELEEYARIIRKLKRYFVYICWPSSHSGDEC